jgi:hypothetical protein
MLHGATNASLQRGPAYQAHFAKMLREEVEVMTQAVGLIRTPELAEQLLQDGTADLIAIGTPGRRNTAGGCPSGNAGWLRWTRPRWTDLNGSRNGCSERRD